ncbi:hypothetical protein G6L58_17280 [Agrobacterium tumefaciens]|uniref:phage tail tube protein n=1 Tax=Agrobacterium tumefaciens TaxID=358 RepID=UPI000EF19273|nr:hypothetical protein At1D1108_34410 [Agrobacterium tumefaciens]NSY92211.1 hypothetical protein [Agrobacterium tumefaciens]
MAGNDFGGRMTVRLANGALLALRGNFTVLSAGQSNEAVTNQDGSTDRVGTPTAPRAEVTFKDASDVDFNALMTAARQNFTIQEEFTGVTHHYFNAFFSGEPSSNRLNGELSGLQIVAEAYRRG